MSGDYATVVGIFERQLKEGKKLTVVSPGTQSRDFTHVDDVTQALVLTTQQNANHEWHLRSGINVTMIELADMFDVEYDFIPERRGERFTSEDFPSDTNEKLGWVPQENLQEWIAHVTNTINA